MYLNKDKDYYSKIHERLTVTLDVFKWIINI